MEEMEMKKNLGVAAGMLVATSFMGWAVADPDLDQAGKRAAEEARITKTSPHGSAESRADRERKYRSCLFTYLPRVGSDVAAEIIRDACQAEYLL